MGPQRTMDSRFSQPWKVEIAGLFVFAAAVAVPLVLIGWGRMRRPRAPYFMEPDAGRAAEADLATRRALDIPAQAACLAALEDHEKEYLMRLLFKSLEGPQGGVPARTRTGAPERCLKEMRVPVFVTLYWPGGKRLRAMAREGNLAQSVLMAAKALREHPGFGEQGFDLAKGVRARIDIVTSARPLSQKQQMCFALDEYAGPVGLALQGEEEKELQVFLPADVADRGVSSRRQMLGFLRLQAGVSDGRRHAAGRSLSQIEAVSFVNAPGSTRCLDTPRGLVQVEDVTTSRLLRSCRLAAGYLLGAQRQDGSFASAYSAASGTFMGEGTLSLDAVVTYALARFSGFGADDKYRAACLKSLARIYKAVYTARAKPGATFVCGESKGERRAALGASALALCAFCEFRRAAQEEGFDGLIERLADFLLLMQKQDGSFELRYDPAQGTANSDGCAAPERRLEASQAALGLVLAYRELRMPRFLLGASKAIKRLTAGENRAPEGPRGSGPGAVFLLLAIREILPSLSVRGYGDFALKMAEAVSELQLCRSDAPAADLWGSSLAATVPTLLVTAREVEILAATWFIASQFQQERADLQSPGNRILQAARNGARYLLQMQLTPENSYFLPDPRSGSGAFRERPGNNLLSTDSVWHALNGLNDLLQSAILQKRGEQ